MQRECDNWMRVFDPFMPLPAARAICSYGTGIRREAGIRAYR
ncbi:hypothetical protein PQ469_01135 [Mucilaginibacter sp. KACC 22773]|nr:hypothetical protein [Mucilaginibacter sp. KACC 22773]WDF78608.1 hypothetical protein PQ469_01135 [Mucilaginibacter sp. KACC 22773]